MVKDTAYLLPSIQQHNIIFSQIVLSEFSWDLLNLKRTLCFGLVLVFFHNLLRYSDFAQTKDTFKRVRLEAAAQFFLLLKDQALN